MSNQPKTNKQLVKAGAKFLDTIDPKWRTLISLEDFDFSALNYCVWGQIRRAIPACEELANYWMSKSMDTYPYALGFEAYDHGIGFEANREELIELWTAEILSGWELDNSGEGV